MQSLRDRMDVSDFFICAQVLLLRSEFVFLVYCEQGPLCIAEDEIWVGNRANFVYGTRSTHVCGTGSSYVQSLGVHFRKDLIRLLCTS